MGLDNFAYRVPDDLMLTEKDEKAFEDAGIDLCGGKISGDASFFRGKFYSALIEAVTSESLYNNWLSPETMKKMSEALSKHTPGKLVSINKKENAYDNYTANVLAGLQNFSDLRQTWTWNNWLVLRYFYLNI